MVSSVVQITAVILLVFLAGLFSGAETGIYQLSRLRLRLGVEKKRFSFIVLGRAMRDSAGLLLSLLVGTNLAHYFVASAVTLMLLSKVRAEPTAELFATLITAPVLFVFSELIPKNIFFHRADYVMPPLATVLFAFQKILTFCGVVPLLKLISRAFAALTGTPPSAKTVISDAREHHIETILQETREEAFLSPVQTDIINRVVRIPGIRIRSVMTPINRVRTVAMDSGSADLLNVLKRDAFTRLPVYEGSPSNIVGFINIYEVLSSEQQFEDLGGFVKPIRRLSADTAVIGAINVLQGENERIVLVTRSGPGGRERPAGIVTMKDLAEELLGELAEW
ncbi:MAG: CNNM domain-containing protein [Planctomycetota bacterium]|jgi:CBS domain containing-hemolysin-like protein